MFRWNAVTRWMSSLPAFALMGVALMSSGSTPGFATDVIPSLTESPTVLEFPGACFGGEHCPSMRSYVIDLREMMPVGWLEFYAHDEVGGRSRAKVDVVVDGQVVYDDLNIEDNWTLYRIPVGRFATVIEIIPDRNDEIFLEYARVRLDVQ